MDVGLGADTDVEAGMGVGVGCGAVVGVGVVDMTGVGVEGAKVGGGDVGVEDWPLQAARTASTAVAATSNAMAGLGRSFMLIIRLLVPTAASLRPIIVSSNLQRPFQACLGSRDHLRGGFSWGTKGGHCSTGVSGLRPTEDWGIGPSRTA